MQVPICWQYRAVANTQTQSQCDVCIGDDVRDSNKNKWIWENELWNVKSYFGNGSKCYDWVQVFLTQRWLLNRCMFRFADVFLYCCCLAHIKLYSTQVSHVYTHKCTFTLSQWFSRSRFSVKPNVKLSFSFYADFVALRTAFFFLLLFNNIKSVCWLIRQLDFNNSKKWLRLW